MTSKKGLTWSTFGILVLLAATFLLLWAFAGNFVGILKEGGDVEACRLSVLAQAQTNKLVGTSPVPFQCNRRQVKLYNNKIEINGQKDTKYDFKELNSNIVNKLVAEELRLCWYALGEGELSVFEQDLIDPGIITFTGESVCDICAEISFDKSVDSTKQFTGLLDYLKSTKVPDGSYYYFDYLIKSQKDKYIFGIVPWTHYTPWSWGTTDQVSENLEENLKKY